jgi:hypothetical protein
MLNKLQAVCNKYEELCARSEQPDFYADPKKAAKQLREKKLLTLASDILGVLIVLSTMFLKQHSVIDVSIGLVMSVMLQMLGDRVFETPTQTALVGERAYRRRSERAAD